MKNLIKRTLITCVALALVDISPLGSKSAEAARNLFEPYIGGYYPRYLGTRYHYHILHFRPYYNPHYHPSQYLPKGHYLQNGRLYHIHGPYSRGDNTPKKHYHYETGWHYH